MKDELLNGIGSRVRAVRLKHDKSQREFAQILGVSASYISEIEAGNQKKPSLKFIASLYIELNVNPNWILLELGEMFIKRERGHKICEYDIGDQNDMLHQLLSVMEKSIYFRDLAMSSLMRSFYSEEDTIKKDLEKDRKLLD